MNQTIHAVFDNELFRPIESVDLPERSEVEFELGLTAKKEDWPKDYFEHAAGVFTAETIERSAQDSMPMGSIFASIPALKTRVVEFL